MPQVLACPELFTHYATLSVPAQSAFEVPNQNPQSFRYDNADLRDWFGGKYEDPVEEMDLNFWQLKESGLASEHRLSQDLLKSPSLRVSQVFALLNMHLAGYDTPLLLSGWPNIFHTMDRSRVRRSLHARWLRGWSLRAYSISDKNQAILHARIVSP